MDAIIIDNSHRLFSKLFIDVWYRYSDINNVNFKSFYAIIDQPALRPGIGILENDNGTQFKKIYDAKNPFS